MSLANTWETVRSRSNLWVAVAAFGVAIVALGMIVEIADSVREADRLVRVDHQIIRFLIDHRTSWLTIVAKVVTQMAGGFVVAPVVIVTVAALIRTGYRRIALVVALSSLGTVVLVAFTKHLVSRARPPVAEHLVSAHGLAFPSGHSAQSVACYGALAWVVWELGRTRRARVLAVGGAAIIAIAVGLSRVYLGVHWPSDVVSGWLLGIGLLAALVGTSHILRRGPETSPEPTA